MGKQLTFLLFLLLPLCGFSQDSTSTESFFSQDFKSDSDGTMGLRQRFMPYTFDNEKAWVKGTNVKDYTQEKIITMLGKPNNSTQDKRSKKLNFNIDYYLSPVFEHERRDVRYVLIITFVESRVTTVAQVMEEVDDEDRIRKQRH